MIDLGCHCIEIARSYIGKEIRPVEVVCWGDTQVHPIEAEDHAIGLVRYENGAIGQFEVSWNFRGGMDLREVQRLLGHRVLATTVRYLAIADRQRHAAVARHPLNDGLREEAA